MEGKPNTQLIVVTLMEPSLCLSCRFANTSTVKYSDGSQQRMLGCMRLDCDNWIKEPDSPTPINVSIDGPPPSTLG